jgi:DNA end-binding protein Ku
MRQAGQVAVARYSARGRQSLVMVRPMGNGLVMEQLRYADEVRPQSEVPIPEAELKEAELKLAMQFVGQLASDEFHPEDYQDEFRNRLLEIIRQKAEGQAVTMAAPETPRAQIIDLMEALKASLAQPAKPAASKAAQAAGEPRKPPKRAPRAAAEAQKKVKTSKA